MWITDRQAVEPICEPAAELGQVTVDGDTQGVALAGERRNLVLCTPGGYHWKPARGDTVLVIKSGAEQTPCVVGKESAGDKAGPGELCLSVAEGTEIRLLAGGGIALTGEIAVTGSLKINGREV